VASTASQWAAIEPIAGKIGCVPQTLNTWVRQHEVDSGQREGVSTSEAQRIKDLERENRELRKANEILKESDPKLGRPFGCETRFIPAWALYAGCFENSGGAP